MGWHPQPNATRLTRATTLWQAAHTNKKYMTRPLISQIQTRTGMNAISQDPAHLLSLNPESRKSARLPTNH